MSEDIKEQLSALMDGELSRDERAFLLRRLEHDAELRATWARMHLARDVLTHRPGASPTVDLADRIMGALAAEDAAPRATAAKSQRWRPWIGAAIAASVAMVAVLSITPRSGLDGAPALVEAPAPRVALPAGVPGPIAPSLNDVGNGVQTVSATSSRIIGGPDSISADQLLLLRHAQVSDGSFMVGGASHLYNTPVVNAQGTQPGQ